MAPPAPLPSLLSFRKQHLLVEFSSLRAAQLDGVFVTITPGDPTLWVGVMFVRKGPYAPAVLRFQISFPSSYPTLPPLVTFSTDVFHPLLTPLTTYTYTTGSSDTDTVSATDEERLPPGGFSLRHGFPQWFGRARRSAASSRNVSGSGTGTPAGAHTPVPTEARDLPAATEVGFVSTGAGKDISIVKVLEYLYSTFSEEDVMDSIPLEAAANPGACHAWRTYRAELTRAQHSPALSSSEPQSGATARLPDNSTLGKNRRPGQWNWEDVWEERVKKAVKASVSEAVLFGGSTAGEDIIRFRDVDDENMERMKRLLKLVPSKATEA
ncbi:ubiquitin-conjugating enzyme/RWD-like protein [Clohesyomyces aquaticus]|uniref:Ubiquitin-conjugating enzyme/RWD-like protein n=1 Tax=Clohesyomyces aquaticus TaxID=1231657 RepID=A0A1Y1ZRD7_9PLEO|nr:ubiquitin-conjugating enzyme/RWD-like protein [Clohesyomyces aquaticus]